MAVAAEHPAALAASETRLERVQGAGGVLLRHVAERPPVPQVAGLWVHQGISAARTDWAAVSGRVRKERADGAWAR